MATATIPVVSTCISKKKQFVSKPEADNFVEHLITKYPDQTRQYSYACEDCDKWHLSTKSPEAFALQTARVEPNNIFSTSVPGLGYKYAHLQSKIRDLYHAGNGRHGVIADIARELDIPYTLIHTFLMSTGVHKTNPHRVESAKVRWSAGSIEGLTAEEEALESKLREIQAKKQALIDAKALKITNTVDNNGVIIRKEGNTLVLSFEDAHDLVAKLTAYLTINKRSI